MESKRLGKYEITNVKAIGDLYWSEDKEDGWCKFDPNQVVEAILIKDDEAEFYDFIGFNMSISDFETEEELEEYMEENSSEFSSYTYNFGNLYFGA